MITVASNETTQGCNHSGLRHDRPNQNFKLLLIIYKLALPPNPQARSSDTNKGLQNEGIERGGNLPPNVKAIIAF
jgi:hypothetical protein